MPTTPSLGVLASGRGTNLQALLDAHARGDLGWPVGVVISNNSGAGALSLARSAHVPTAHISGASHEDPGAAILATLRAHGVEVVVLAGYLKLLDARVVRAYRGRVLNIHPAPLPRFGGPGMYGDRVHRAVLDAGVTCTGPTVHLVDEVYDQGEVLAHRAVPVAPDDTVARLSERVLQAEHDLLWRVIQRRFCEGAAPTSPTTPGDQS